MDEYILKKHTGVLSLFYVYKDENICGIVIIKLIFKKGFDSNVVRQGMGMYRISQEEFETDYMLKIFFYSEITTLDYNIANEKNNLINEFILLPSNDDNAVYEFIIKAKRSMNNFIFGFYKGLDIFLKELIARNLSFPAVYYEDTYKKFEEEIKKKEEEIKKKEEYDSNIRGALETHMGFNPQLVQSNV